jgi:2-dehydro-3-deoxygalactonokinase
MTRPFIALDWGTTSFRAYHVNAKGEITDQTSAPEGIMAVKDAKFEDVLEHHIGAWDKGLPVVASGMITSRQGWVECAYVDCPAGADELAKNIRLHKTTSGRNIHFITGLHHNSPSITHDVLRGEETQVIGSLKNGATHFVTPGTHSKIIDVIENKITSFATYMTGETFGLYRNHSILGRLMANDSQDEMAFKHGVEKALEDPAGILHLLFSVRSLGLFNEIKPESLSSYLSGLLIGQEMAHATRHHDKSAAYQVLGSASVGNNYVTALNMAGFHATLGDPLCGVYGQRIVAEQAGVI